MRARRLMAGISIMALLVVLLVPIWFACVIVASESDLAPAQFVRISRARDWLFAICCALEIGAAWLLHTCSGAQRNASKKAVRLVGFLAAAIVGSTIAGIAIAGIAEHAWYALASRLFL